MADIKHERKHGTFYSLKKFVPYYKKYIPILILDLLCASLTTVVEIYLPIIAKQITQRATDDIASLTTEFILKIGLLYIVMRIVDTVAYYYMATVGHLMGAKIESDMRGDFFSHLQKLSFSYYNNVKVGTLMSRITSDLFDVTEFAHHCPEEFFIAGIKIIVSFIILCGINIPLTLIIFAIIPIMVVCLSKFRIKMKQSFIESRKIAGELNADVEDSLLGIREVKSYANEQIEVKKFSGVNHKLLNIAKAKYRHMGQFQSTTRLFDGIMYIAVVIAGSFFIKNSQIDASDFVAYILFAGTLITSVRRLVEFTEQFQRGLTGIDRFLEVMETEPDIIDSKSAKDIYNVKGKIDFNDVTFRYSEGRREVISHLNLSVDVGENIALVGPSGGGKTTLCSLLPRFYDTVGGEILIDGINIKDYTQKSLRSNIGIVQQEVYLFSGSIKDNIKYGKVDATDEEIIEAAKKAGAYEFIMELPDGFDTYVGERGMKLSGGQKQRISIARVFLKNPPILILDEATSSLDNESEHYIQASLEELTKGRTTLTVAHRLTTIKNADRILVLTRNGIEESGKHKELLKKDGLYASLYKMYTKD